MCSLIFWVGVTTYINLTEGFLGLIQIHYAKCRSNSKYIYLILRIHDVILVIIENQKRIGVKQG